MQIDLIKGEGKFLISGWIILRLWKFWGKARISICNFFFSQQMYFHLHSCAKIIFIYFVTSNFSLGADLMLGYQEVSFSGLQNNPPSGKKSVLFLPTDMVSSF